MSEEKTQFIGKINAYLDGEIGLKHLKLFLITAFPAGEAEDCEWLWRGVTGHAAMFNLGTWSEETLKDAYRWMLRRDAGDLDADHDPMFDQQWSQIMFCKDGPPWQFEVVNIPEEARRRFLQGEGFSGI